MIHPSIKATSSNGYAYLIVYCYKPHPLIPQLKHPHSTFNKLHQLLSQFVIYTTNRICYSFQTMFPKLFSQLHSWSSQTQNSSNNSHNTLRFLHLSPSGTSTATGTIQTPLISNTKTTTSLPSNLSFRNYLRTYATPLYTVRTLLAL